MQTLDIASRPLWLNPRLCSVRKTHRKQNRETQQKTYHISQFDNGKEEIQQKPYHKLAHMLQSRFITPCQTHYGTEYL